MVLAIQLEGLSRGMVSIGDELTQVQLQVLQDRPDIRLEVVRRARTDIHLGLQTQLT